MPPPVTLHRPSGSSFPRVPRESSSLVAWPQYAAESRRSDASCDCHRLPVHRINCWNASVTFSHLGQALEAPNFQNPSQKPSDRRGALRRAAMSSSQLSSALYDFALRLQARSLAPGIAVLTWANGS